LQQEDTMYDRAALGRFLADEQIDATKLTAINARIDDVCNHQGFFSGGQLDSVVGDDELAEKYRQAFERSSRYR
jgi:hypothetical protein